MTSDPRLDGAGFLRRWSERKRAAKAAPIAEPESETPIEAAEAPEPFDPESLPSIESLTAESDYAAFLRPGVPAELTRAALRRAWASDPFISTFKEMADYDWDFNAPGYGALLPTDDVQALLARVVNRPEPTPEPTPEPAPETPSPARPAEPDAEPAAAVSNDEAPVENFVAPPALPAPQDARADTPDAASQHEPASLSSPGIQVDPPLRRPRHGGALPL